MRFRFCVASRSISVARSPRRISSDLDTGEPSMRFWRGGLYLKGSGFSRGTDDHSSRITPVHRAHPFASECVDRNHFFLWQTVPYAPYPEFRLRMRSAHTGLFSFGPCSGSCVLFVMHYTSTSCAAVRERLISSSRPSAQPHPKSQHKRIRATKSHLLWALSGST